MARFGRGFPIRPHLARPIVAPAGGAGFIAPPSFVVSAVRTNAQIYARRRQSIIPRSPLPPPASYVFTTVVFTSGSGNYTVPVNAWATSNVVVAIGGGGGGGFSDAGAGAAGGGGGGGGGTAALSIVPGSTYSYAVGGGGSGGAVSGASGNNGTDTTVATITGGGGQGGTSASSSTPGTGGAGGSAPAGRSGIAGQSGGASTGGDGGASSGYSIVSGGTGGTGGASGVNGNPGNAPGGGGGGGGRHNSGGNGASGSVTFGFWAPASSSPPVATTPLVISSAAKAAARSQFFRRINPHLASPIVGAAASNPPVATVPYIVATAKQTARRFVVTPKPHVAKPLVGAPPAPLVTRAKIVSAVQAIRQRYQRSFPVHHALPIVPLPSWTGSYIFMRNLELTSAGLSNITVSLPQLSAPSLTCAGISGDAVLTQFDQI